MSDLTELIKQQWEIAPNAAKSLTENFAAGRKAQAEKMQMQEHQDLKALFASQAKPSVSSIGAIDPEFAQKTMKMQYDMYKDQADIELKQARAAELLQKEDQLKRQEMANGLKPLIERYEQQKASGIPEAQAGGEYQAASGALVANQAQAGRLYSEKFIPSLSLHLDIVLRSTPVVEATSSRVPTEIISSIGLPNFISSSFIA